MGFGYSATSWTSWPSCNHPRTLSFRDDGEDYRDPRYLVNNPLWIDEDTEEGEEEEATMESVLRGVKRTTESSGRLFFEPAGDSSSILLNRAEEHENYDQRGSFLVTQHKGTAESTAAAPFKVGGVAVKVKSADPYADFRASMQEMIVAHGWMGWDWLQEMLEWYLQANGAGANTGKCSGHSDTILQAFVDMIMQQVFEIPRGDSADSDGWASDSPTPSSSSSSSFAL